MPNRLLGILLCLVLANVVNYGVNQWLDKKIPGWLPPQSSLDGSSLSSSLAYQGLLEGKLPASEINGAPLAKVLIPYYDYLAEGGGERWLTWRKTYDEHYGAVVTQQGDEAEQAWNTRFLRLVDRTAPVKYASILLFIVILLLLRGGMLKEQYWWTPLAYALFIAATAALYTAFDAPAYLALIVGSFVLYAAALRFILPIYTFEWSKSLRPFLTLVLFFLFFMGWRGPEWIDYLFWTSQLYRLGLVSVVLLTLFFHWDILHKNLENASLDLTSRITAYAMPLGILAIFLGIFLGFFRSGSNGSMFALNQELLLFTPDIVKGFNPDMPFVLFFAGVALLIIGGIGYFIQRIAK